MGNIIYYTQKNINTKIYRPPIPLPIININSVKLHNQLNNQLDTKLDTKLDTQLDDHLDKFDGNIVVNVESNKLPYESTEIIINDKILDLSIDDIVNNLIIEENDTEITNQILNISKKIENYNATELINFWNNFGIVILKKIKHSPELCINLKMHMLPLILKNKYMVLLGVLIFNINQNDALIMLYSDLNKAFILLKKYNEREAIFLINPVANKKLIMKNAYSCLSKHRYGYSYLLFKKSNHYVAANNIIKQKSPEYIQKLLL